MRAVLIVILLSVAGCSLDYDGFQVESSAGAGAFGALGGSGPGGGSGSASGSGGSGTGGSTTGGDGSGAGAPAGGGGTGGNSPCTTVTYVATIADCARVDDPDPDACKSLLNPAELIIDTFFTDAGGGQYEGFLRFDLDGAFAVSDVTSVTLRMTASPAGASDDTGDIYSVAAFERVDLFSTGTLPVTVAGPIAGSQGALANDSVIDWPLPTDVAVPGQPVALRVHPLSGDGARYRNTDGADPPLLIVSCM